MLLGAENPDGDGLAYPGDFALRLLVTVAGFWLWKRFMRQ